MLRHHRLLLTASLAAGSTLFAGCSSLPTQPVDTAPRPTVAAPATAAVPAQTALQSASTTKVVSALLGGVVAVGDFKVIIPPLALPSTATITVIQPDLAKLECELRISPASANRFRLPVTLIANGSKLDTNLLKISQISRYDPGTGKWEPVALSSVSLLNLTIQAPLWHFSQYRVDTKAGW